MHKKDFTVFTATLNRANTLSKLYESLCQQTIQNFEWVIINDGSTDATEDLIQGFIQKSSFQIKYLKQDNGGKHRAINKGVQIAEGELFFIVDSDDYLVPNSLEIISKYWNQVNTNTKFAGVAGKKIDTHGNDIGDSLKSAIMDCSITERRYKFKINGDKAEAILTSIMKKYPFPDYPSEKFCAEGLIWNRISLEKKLRFFDEAIYVCEYLENGLSQNSIKNRKANSNYTLLFYSELSKNKQVPFLYKIRAILNFWRFSFTNNNTFNQKRAMLNTTLLGILLFPIGYLFHVIDYFFDTVKTNQPV
jgi:glycosyltransferase involved in cell wall biosynthesis